MNALGLNSAEYSVTTYTENEDIKVIEGEKGLFIAMPSRKTPDGEFKDIVHPLNTETREMIRDIVLKAFDEAKEKIQKALNLIEETDYSFEKIS